MEKEKINEWIDRYNQGTLKGRDLERFLRLLADDPDLQREVMVDREINRMMADRELLAFREAILKAKQRIPGRRIRWMLLAAMVTVLLSAGGFMVYYSLFLNENPSIRGTEVTSRSDTSGGNVSPEIFGTELAEDQKPPITSDESKQPMIAQNFVRNSSLEVLVGEHTRADGMILEEPGSDLKKKIGDQVCFRWRTENADPVEILLFDNRGNRILSVVLNNKKEYLLPTTALEPGLYYWKMLMNDLLVTAGKIRLE